jgi:hypothetical protein
MKFHARSEKIPTWHLINEHVTNINSPRALEFKNYIALSQGGSSVLGSVPLVIDEIRFLENEN